MGLDLHNPSTAFENEGGWEMTKIRFTFQERRSALSSGCRATEAAEVSMRIFDLLDGGVPRRLQAFHRPRLLSFSSSVLVCCNRRAGSSRFPQDILSALL